MSDEVEGSDAVAPVYRKFEYHTIVVGDDAECIALLTQVMKSYPNANCAAVAAWFSQAYAHPKTDSLLPVAS